MARTYFFSLKRRMPSSNNASAEASAFAAELDHGIDGIEGKEIDEQPDASIHVDMRKIAVFFHIESSPSFRPIFY
jgi:hypothetical protein